MTSGEQRNSSSDTQTYASAAQTLPSSPSPNDSATAQFHIRPSPLPCRSVIRRRRPHPSSVETCANEVAVRHDLKTVDRTFIEGTGSSAERRRETFMHALSAHCEERVEVIDAEGYILEQVLVKACIAILFSKLVLQPGREGRR